MSERFSCARAATERGEPLYATASRVRRWLLVEQPGPWGVDAPLESRMPAEVGQALCERARDLGARLLLLRRHGRADVSQSAFSVFVGHTSRYTNWVERFVVGDPAEILDLDLYPMQDGSRVGGEPVAGPLYLVCTNGRHDVCCAEFGRPIAEALDAVRPESTWECSHVGGDRFAGNLVVLPHGLYYGRVGPDLAVDIAAEYEQGRVVLDHYRGRSCYSFLVQAAEHFLRAAEGLVGIQDVLAVRRHRTGPDTWEVVFLGPDARHISVHVAVTRGEQPLRLTCRARDPSQPPRYELLSID